MAPSLYAADAFVGKPKKIHEASTQPPEDPNAGPAQTKKRVVSEETKAKLREAQQRRKQQRLEKERADQEWEEATRREQEAAAAAAQAKKEAATKKRREARLKRKHDAESSAGTSDTASVQGPPTAPKKETPSPPAGNPAGPPPSQDGTLAEEVQAPPAKKQRKERNGPKAATAPVKRGPRNPDNEDAPPPWFNKFVGAMMQEKNEQQGIRVNKKHLKEAATQEAENRWRDGYTRDRVRATVDDHVSRMYGMIFG